MPITEHQAKLRNRGIGSSDAAAILGLDAYRSPYDVWLEKTGQLEGGFEGNEATEIGNMVENSLLDWAAAETGHPITKNQRRVHSSRILASSCDALARDTPLVGYEAKTAGIVNPFSANDEWGDEGTDEIPMRYIVQCHHQMVCAGTNVVFVPALIGGRGRVLYQINRNATLASGMEEALIAWWRNHVERMVPPADSIPSLDVAKRVRREEGSKTWLDSDIVQSWRVLADAANAAEKAEKEARAAILAALGDNEIGESDLGVVSYKKQSRASIDTKRMAAEHPEIARAYGRVTTFPVLRFKEAKTK